MQPWPFEYDALPVQRRLQHPPDQDADHQQDEGRPGQQRIPGRNQGARRNGTITFHVELIFWLPELQENDQATQRRERRQNIDQIRPHEVRNQELHATKREPAEERGGQNAPERFPAPHHQHQIGRNNDRDRSADSPDARAQTVQRQTSHALQSQNRDADGAKRHRGRVCQQANAAGVERRKTESCQHGCRHRDGSPEPGGTFYEGTEREGNQQSLETPVIG